MKIVIYTQRVEVIKSYQERRDCTDQRIVDFIASCGFLPIPVPNRADLASQIMETLQPTGIILTGGNSLVSYGGNAPERDAMDHVLIELAVRNKIPLYGFCRGMQSLLTYFGNELVSVEGHVAVRHVVRADGENYEVNSYHNQACKELKENCQLQVMAQTDDGVIEAVRHESLPIEGTMWHPERETSFVKRDMDRVKNLFAKQIMDNTTLRKM